MVANAVKKFLQQAGIFAKSFVASSQSSLLDLATELSLDLGEVAATQILQTDSDDRVMAIYPLNRDLDIERINALLRRQFYTASADWLSEKYHCQVAFCPPLTALFKMPCLVDRALLELPEVFIPTGSAEELLQLNAADFSVLVRKASKAIISNPIDLSIIVMNRNVENSAADTGADPSAAYEQVKARLQSIYRLPPMPAIAYKIIAMVNDPEMTSKELAAVVELDPSVAAQVIRYARSSFYNYGGEVDSVQVAITRVLGFDLVCNLALGIASSQAFNIPKDGPLGLRTYWRHSLYCAILCQTIAKKLPGSLALNPEIAYLSGLLHNLGVLLIGHLHPDAFAKLNQLAAANPQLSLHELEQQATGFGSAQTLIEVGHAQLGAWLLERWQLPAEVVCCCAYHNQADYGGDHDAYVQLVQLSNQLLGQAEIGDQASSAIDLTRLPNQLLAGAALHQAYDEVMAMCGEIDQMATQIAA